MCQSRSQSGPQKPCLGDPDASVQDDADRLRRSSALVAHPLLAPLLLCRPSPRRLAASARPSPHGIRPFRLSKPLHRGHCTETRLKYDAGMRTTSTRVILPGRPPLPGDPGPLGPGQSGEEDQGPHQSVARDDAGWRKPGPGTTDTAGEARCRRGWPRAARTPGRRTRGGPHRRSYRRST